MANQSGPCVFRVVSRRVDRDLLRLMPVRELRARRIMPFVSRTRGVIFVFADRRAEESDDRGPGRGGGPEE